MTDKLEQKLFNRFLNLSHFHSCQHNFHNYRISKLRCRLSYSFYRNNCLFCSSSCIYTIRIPLLSLELELGTSDAVPAFHFSISIRYQLVMVNPVGSCVHSSRCTLGRQLFLDVKLGHFGSVAVYPQINFCCKIIYTEDD